MIDKKLQRKLDTAMYIAKALDEPFETMIKTHGIVISPLIESLELSPAGELCISMSFIHAKTLPELIATLMHEARHHAYEHHARWGRFRELVRNWVLPKSLMHEDGTKQWCTIFRLWNIACDCEINSNLKHMPIIRDSTCIRVGKFPCTHLRITNAEGIMEEWLRHDEQAREEVLEFLKENQ